MTEEKKMIEREETNYWRAPHARIPVRGHLSVPPGPEENLKAADAAVFLAAAAVTTGTVLIENWPAAGSEELAARNLFADMGLYVVASPDGLTVTSRSTGGNLQGVEADFSAVPDLAPLAAILAALAETPSSLHGVGPVRAEGIMANLRGVGTTVDFVDSTLRISPAPLSGDCWPNRGDAHLVLAGMVMALKLPGLRVEGMTSAAERIPGFEALWNQVLNANEYLLPGSRKMPHDYLLTPEDSQLLLSV